MKLNIFKKKEKKKVLFEVNRTELLQYVSHISSLALQHNVKLSFNNRSLSVDEGLKNALSQWYYEIGIGKASGTYSAMGGNLLPHGVYYSSNQNLSMNSTPITTAEQIIHNTIVMLKKELWKNFNGKEMYINENN